MGRILGPGGRTIKELEKHTGSKIMVRGKGSVRNVSNVRIVVYIENICRFI